MNIKAQIRNVKSTIANLEKLIAKEVKLLKELEAAERSRIKSVENGDPLPTHFFKVLPTDVDIDSIPIKDILPEKKHMPGQPSGVLIRICNGLNNMDITTIGELKKLSPKKLYKKRVKSSWYGNTEPREGPRNFGASCIRILLASMRHHNIQFDENKK